MARIVGPARTRERFSTRVRGSELIVFLIVALGLAYAARYYFVVYRHSPGFALGEYLGAIKAGDVSKQYALIDAADKRDFFPTEQTYEKGAPQARGYAARVISVKFDEQPADPKKPHIVVINANVSIRGSAQGKALYETSSDAYKDTYTLREDKEGHWKVWLGRSQMNMLKASPSPPGDPINSG